MDIREKIAARNAERKNDDELKRGLWRMLLAVGGIQIVLAVLALLK